MEIRELYSPEKLSALKRKNRISFAALFVFICAAFAVCITLAVTKTTLTAGRHELITMAVSVLAGWAAIYWGLDVVLARKKLIAHAENLLTGERERYSGDCEIKSGRVLIPGSVEVVKVRVGDRLLNLDRALLRDFPCGGKSVRVECVHSYIVSWEAEL